MSPRLSFLGPCLIVGALGCGSSSGAGAPPPTPATSTASAGSQPASAGREGPPAASTAPRSAPSQEPPAEASAWPETLMAGPGDGQPGLFLGSESDAPAIGYVSEGVLLDVAGAPRNGRIPVRIRAGMRVRGWFPVSRLVGRVLRRGRIGGTSIYVGPNDLLAVVGPAAEGYMRVRGTIGLRPGAPAEGPSFEGTFPTIGLGGRRVEVSPEADVPGSPHRLPAGREVPIRSEPGGEVVYLAPAADPPLAVRVAAERGEWKAVLLGTGPYIAGYVQADLTPADATALARTRSAETSGSGGVPERLRAESHLPLFLLPAGVRIRFNGVTLAAVDEPAHAREMNRYEASGEVDVFVAADNRVAVRGMISAEDLARAERISTSGE